MASVRDTIYGMLTQYPSLFSNRSDCFVHLFLTNGNGYEWENGELIDVCRYSAKTKPDFKNEDDEVQKETDKDSYDWGVDCYNYLRLDIRRNNMRIQFAIDNIELMMKESLRFYSTSRTIHYSGWEFCKLMDAPKDIKEDWKQAVLECMNALMPYINQTLPYCDNRKQGLEQLTIDLKRLKEERFPEEIKREKDMAEYVKKLLAKNN